MTNLPEDNQHEPAQWPHESSVTPDPGPPQPMTVESLIEGPSPGTPPHAPIAIEPVPTAHSQQSIESPYFQPFLQPPPPIRIPHLGHLFLVGALALMGFIAAIGLFIAAVHFHLFGATSIQQAGTQIQFILGVEAAMYFFTFGAAFLVFPAFWHKNLLDGLQWNTATAVRLRWRLLSLAVLCFLLAWLNGELMPSPTNTPIEKVFRTPGAAWLLFGFGVTIAPFFEEMFFRGFLLPAVSTAADWIAEKVNADVPIESSRNGRPEWPFRANSVAAIVLLSMPAATFLALYWRGGHFALRILPPYLVALLAVLLVLALRKTHMHEKARPIDSSGNPLWSASSMIVASVFTSIPFAAMHAEQTGYSIGPFLLLVGVSLTLCAVRLVTRSLSSSVLVHATYNFLLFLVMLIGTGGFRHFDKM
jgi:uncharacterized protein